MHAKILMQQGISFFLQVWAAFISFLIVVSTLTEAIASTSIFTVNYTESEKIILKQVGELLSWDDSEYKRQTAMKRHPYLTFIDILCHSIITLEFILNLLVCPNKTTYLLSFFLICTMIGYISFWMKFILQFEKVI